MSDIGSLKEWVKTHFYDTLPLTISGLVLIFIMSLSLDIYSLAFTLQVVTTGLSIVALGCCYVIGYSTLYLMNAIISRFTHEKRSTQ